MQFTFYAYFKKKIIKFAEFFSVRYACKNKRNPI